MDHSNNQNTTALAVGTFAGFLHACSGLGSDLSWAHVIAAATIAVITGFCYRAGSGIAAWAKGWLFKKRDDDDS